MRISALYLKNLNMAGLIIIGGIIIFPFAFIAWDKKVKRKNRSRWPDVFK